MARTIRTVRRCIAAALAAGQAVVTAVRGHHYRLLVALYRAIDSGATVRIQYRDRDGKVSERDIQPRGLWISDKGHIVLTAHDLLREDRRTFRTANMQLAA